MIHAVGPRLGDAAAPHRHQPGAGRAPKVTLVGKGVTFDTGGLDIKPAAGMLLMKKDMGGAAKALALAQMIMAADLPVRLRVLVPAVENMPSPGLAFRPGDVLKSRKGLTVEIGNTDAEGRLILADALALADEEEPGAARRLRDPDRRGPRRARPRPAALLHRRRRPRRRPRCGSAQAVERPGLADAALAALRALLDSKVADINTSRAAPFAGSITAALFLRRFVDRRAAHVHFDVYAWNPTAQPGPARGRRGAGRAPRLCAPEGALRRSRD